MALSYPVSFRPCRGLNHDRFLAEVDGRPGYVLDGDRATLSNAETGASFELTWLGGLPSQDGAPSRSFEMSIPLGTSDVFGFQAARELERLASLFDGLIDEPEGGALGGRFERAGFLERWHGANARALADVVAPDGELDPARVPPALPRAELERLWRWNTRVQERLTRQTRRDFPAQVPPVRFSVQPAGVRSLAVWADGEPVLLPKVDLVMISRDKLAPKILWAQGDIVFGLADWGDLEEILPLFHPHEADVVFWELDHGLGVPKAVFDFVRRKRRTDREIKGTVVRLRDVFGEETIAAAVAIARGETPSALETPRRDTAQFGAAPP